MRESHSVLPRAVYKRAIQTLVPSLDLPRPRTPSFEEPTAWALGSAQLAAQARRSDFARLGSFAPGTHPLARANPGSPVSTAAARGPSRNTPARAIQLSPT